MPDHACPCCGETRFAEGGSYEICLVCNWEDDPAQADDVDFAGGANQMSLRDARSYWQNAGKPLPPNRTPEREEARASVRALGQQT